jgi:hypothetical protein
VAIKVLRPDFSAEISTERFKREIQFAVATECLALGHDTSLIKTERFGPTDNP